MAIIKEEQSLQDAVLTVAKLMIAAAKTAPKARGNDNLCYAIITGHEKEQVASKMLELSETFEKPFFKRDSENITQSSCIVVIGTTINPVRLQEICGLCGFKNCSEKDEHPSIPCIYNTTDLGIALSSAAQTAMQHKIDNRIMFSIGKAVHELKLLPEEYTIIFGIPLSTTKKNIFFDR